jgi:hydrogenase maturation factor
VNLALAVLIRIQTGGAIRNVDLVMIPAAIVGDYVVVHAGYAIKGSLKAVPETHSSCSESSDARHER